jgi:hypothetical protein
MVRIRKDERRVRLLFIVFALIIGILIANLVFLNYLQLERSTNPTLQAAAIKPTVTPIITQAILPSPTAAQTAALPQVTAPPTKDYFIPLGSGTSQASDWQDIPGAQATVDLSQYRTIKQIVFEASVVVPNAEQIVYLRLYNVTDKHPVWYSDLTLSNASTYSVSQPMTIDPGVKTYQVQIKTQLNAPATLTQARIHVQLQ